MSYSFEIKEIDNGWILHSKVYGEGEYYRTLNELCEVLLDFVHENSPGHHRNTKQTKPEASGDE